MLYTKIFTRDNKNARIGLQLNRFNQLITLSTDKGLIMDVKDVSSKLTMDVISSTAFGLDVNSFENSNLDFRRYGKMIFHTTYRRGFELLSFFFLPNILRMFKIKLFGAETTAYLRKLFWETISTRIKSGEKRHDLINILVELKTNESDKEIDGFSKRNNYTYVFYI
jgi:cytochrome P450 family 6